MAASGAIGIAGIGILAIGGAYRFDPSYDLIAAIDTLAPGIVLQRATLDGVAAAWAANGFQPLTQDQVVAVTGPLPIFPTTIRRMQTL